METRGETRGERLKRIMAERSQATAVEQSTATGQSSSETRDIQQVPANDSPQQLERVAHVVSTSTPSAMGQRERLQRILEARLAGEGASSGVDSQSNLSGPSNAPRLRAVPETLTSRAVLEPESSRGGISGRKHPRSGPVGGTSTGTGSQSNSGSGPVNTRPSAESEIGTRSRVPNTSHSPGSSGSPVPELTEGMSSISIIDPSEKMGRAGRKQNVLVNYIKIDTHANSFFQYSVEFRPNIDNVNLRKRAVRSQEELRYANFDGNTTLFSIRSIARSDYTFTTPRDNETVEIRLNVVRQIGPGSRQSCVMLNMMFNKLMRILNYKVEKKAAYLTSNPIVLHQHKMEIWPGYVNTVSQVDGGLLLQCDVSHRVVRTQNVYDLMSEISQTVRPENFRERVAKELCSQVILTRYNKKTYRVDDIDWGMNPSKTFKKSDGTEMSFLQYYEENYDVQIADPHQPLLMSIMKNKRNPEMPPQTIYLVPELCFLTGLSDKTRDNFQVMKEISEHTKPNPVNRVDALRKFVQSIYDDPNARLEMHNWGVDLARDPLSMEARNIVEGNFVHFANQRRPINAEVDFGRDLDRNQCMGGGVLHTWIVCYPKKEYNRAKELFGQLSQCMRNVGVEVANPDTLELDRDRAEDYVAQLRARMKRETQLVMTVFSTQRDDTYNAVKKLTCSEKPVASQCVLSRTLGKPQKLKRIALNIGLQMVAKLGGQLWEVNIPPKLHRAMFIGIDVYHQKAGKTNSVVGFVATRNPGASKYFSQTFDQGQREEIMTNNLRQATISAIQKFKEESKFLPDSIVVFRDGVGDHQMDIVKDTEIALMKRAFSDISPEYSPHFCVVVVQKRISARIFAVDRSGNIGNAPPGTVIDHTITKRGTRDFYLVSQHVRQGTVTPTRYVVLENTPGGAKEQVSLDIDTIQSLAFKLTFLYYNWPGSVRVPAPCQYAHKLAQLVGMNIGKSAHQQLEDKLFYL